MCRSKCSIYSNNNSKILCTDIMYKNYVHNTQKANRRVSLSQNPMLNPQVCVHASKNGARFTCHIDLK